MLVSSDISSFRNHVPLLLRSTVNLSGFTQPNAPNYCFIIQQCLWNYMKAAMQSCTCVATIMICRSVLKSILFYTNIRLQKNTKTLRFENLSLRNIEKWEFLVKESSEAFTQLWYPMCCEPTTTFSANSFLDRFSRHLIGREIKASFAPIGWGVWGSSPSQRHVPVTHKASLRSAYFRFFLFSEISERSWSHQGGLRALEWVCSD